MNKTDKVKLDNLPSNGFVSLDAAGRVPSAQAPAIMLRNVSDSVLDDLHEGDFYFDSGSIYFVGENSTPIQMGPPSKNVIYCHRDTNILYRWTGSEFVPMITDPNYAMQYAEVRRNNTTQKIYDIPNGKLAVIKATTDVVNITLSPASTGASVHRIIMYANDFMNVETINWPSTLIWANDRKPDTGQYVTDCEGLMIEIYDMKFAEFKSYGR